MLRWQLTDLPQFRRDLMVERWGTLTVGDLYAVSQKASETIVAAPLQALLADLVSRK